MSEQERSYEEAMKKGPTGSGPVGFQVPQAATQTKDGPPADEVSPKAIGPEADNANGAATLGVLTQGDREGALEANTPIRQEVVGAAQPSADVLTQSGPSHGSEGMRPESAQAKDIAPDAELQERIPETQRENESPAGLGKGVGLPPGSAGRETGQTP
ncbi:MAG TPA: hypothetical protein VFW71_14795 [Actinomycetota bacterium]|nr:hypothetical protein [Actinomycetota bacterium]